MSTIPVDDKDFDAAFGEAVTESEKETTAAPAKDEPAPAAAPAADETAKKAAEDKAVADAKAAEAQQKADADAVANKAAEDKAKQEAAEKKAEDTRRAALTDEQRVAEDKAKQEAAEKKARDDAEAKVRAEAETRVRVEVEAKTKQEATAKAEADRKAAEEKVRKDVEDLLKPYEYTAEEKTAMETFKKDFPTEYAGMEARFKAEAKANQANSHKLMSAILTRVQEVVAPLAQGYTADAEERHFQAVHTAHTDFDTLVGLVPAWIEKQPAYLQKAYQAAYDGGSTQEVIDLMTRFKQETGRTKPVMKSATELEAERKAAEAAELKRKGPSADEIASHTPVGTRRATPSQRGAADPNDYDGAFAEAAGK